MSTATCSNSNLNLLSRFVALPLKDIYKEMYEKIEGRNKMQKQLFLQEKIQQYRRNGVQKEMKLWILQTNMAIKDGTKCTNMVFKIMRNC